VAGEHGSVLGSGEREGPAVVLVVDDDASVRESLRRALQLEGYAVELAADGAEALDRLRNPPEPDAIVLDMMLPHFDGLEVARRLRRTGSRTPVLMLTARAALEDRIAGFEAGADDYVVKPFALEELLARLNALVRRVRDDSWRVEI
jgi:two-component system, OmpR family, response regulator MprA